MATEEKNAIHRNTQVSEIIGSPPSYLIRWGAIILFVITLSLLIIASLTPYYEIVTIPIKFPKIGAKDVEFVRLHVNLNQKYYSIIKVGQQINIKLVAYPYHNFGLVKSSIDKVQPINSETGDFYIELLLPKHLKTSINSDLIYQAGLLGDADIIIKRNNMLSNIISRY